MKVKSGVIIILALCLLLISGVIIYLRITRGIILSKEDMEQILKEQKLPVIEVFPSYVVDMNNLSEVVGDADYVFVAQVEEYVTSFYDTDIEEDVETVYKVKVLENIKGVLEDKESIQVRKAGGVSKNGKNLVIFRNDLLPKCGKKYIFSAYGQPDGSLLCTGFNTSIPINKDNNIPEDPSYQNIVTSYKNQIITPRKRFTSIYEKVAK